MPDEHIWDREVYVRSSKYGDEVVVRVPMHNYGNSMEDEHLSNFTPDLIYTYDLESGKIECILIKERCKELGMVLTDEQAVSAVHKLIDLISEESHKEKWNQIFRYYGGTHHEQNNTYQS